MKTINKITKSDIKKILKGKSLNDVLDDIDVPFTPSLSTKSKVDKIRYNLLWDLRKIPGKLEEILSECRKGDRSYPEIAKEFHTFGTVVSVLARKHGIYRLITAPTVRKMRTHTITLF